MGTASIDQKVYVVGGADYNSKEFCVFHDCKGGNPGLGKHLLILDLEDLAAGWKRGEGLPGSPRWVFSVTAVRGAIYVIGGATTNSSVVDNWKYEPAAAAAAESSSLAGGKWSALPNLVRFILLFYCFCTVVALFYTILHYFILFIYCFLLFVC